MSSLPEAVSRKLAYLNIPFFLLRSLIYAVLWSALAAGLLFLEGKARRALSALGLIVYALTVTFFPMIILAWTIERMSIVWEEDGPYEVVVQAGGSLLLCAECLFNFLETDLGAGANDQQALNQVA